jgi:hypothetical protein
MSTAADADSDRALRKLFLALFLRGRGARGLQKDNAPGSIAKKLWLALALHAAVGLMALAFIRSPVFVMSLYMHAITFMMLGMFIAASAGEVLFNKEEAEILMHRPVTPEALLRAKILMMLQVSAWIAGALNLATVAIGVLGRNGHWAFLPAHVISTMLSALFSIGLVVMTYQLGLRWIGRERLDNLLTTIQVIVSVSFIVGMQVLPRLMANMPDGAALAVDRWWLLLLPPAWFAGVDALLMGDISQSSIMLALAGVVATGGLTYLATVTLAASFGRGLQKMQDVSAPRPEHARKRRLPALVRRPPLSWWLRDPVSRASFLLVTAYMLRDREVKLRLYPAIAPVMVFPIIMLVGSGSRGGGSSDFALAFGSVYLCVVPISAINLLEFSQQWQASDVFRVAPISGPGRILHGVRRAVLLLLALPMFIGIAALSFAIAQSADRWPILIPGLVALPVFAMIACAIGQPLPLSRATDEAKTAGRGAAQVLLMIGAVVMGFVTLSAWKANQIWTLVLIEGAAAVAAYIMCRQLVNDAKWRPIS